MNKRGNDVFWYVIAAVLAVIVMVVLIAGPIYKTQTTSNRIDSASGSVLNCYCNSIQRDGSCTPDKIYTKSITLPSGCTKWEDCGSTSCYGKA